MNRSPLRKYSVFVSSVTSESKEARIAACMGILNAGHIPILIEEVPIGANVINDEIRFALDQSDMLLMLVGSKLGSFVDPATGNQTFVQLELDMALRLGIPIITYDIRPSGPDEIPRDEEQRRLEGLYQSLVSQAKAAGAFEKIAPDRLDDLQRHCRDTIATQATRMRSGGWIPATGLESESELISLGIAVRKNPFFRRFVDRLDSFNKLSERTTNEWIQKEVMADFFWQQFLPRLAEQKINRLFFESGSTIAYLARAFIELFAKRWVRTLHGELEMQIETNNILAYLEFMLMDPNSDPITPVLYPGPPAEEYYGATFGEFTKLVDFYPPTSPRELDKEAKSEVAKFQKRMQVEYEKNGLILMTSSGLDMDPNSDFTGPHVGSYYNKLIKRALLGNSAPTVMFLEEFKIGRAFKTGRCYAVCDTFGKQKQFGWKNIRKTCPLAIVTCTSSDESREEMAQQLGTLGFDFGIRGVDDRSVWPLLAANSVFANKFGLDDPLLGPIPNSPA